MKNLWGLLLPAAVLFSVFGQTVLFVHYKANLAYYSSELCENKSEPQLRCHGSCQLNKELRQQEKQADHPAAPQNTKHEFTYYYESLATVKTVDGQPGKELAVFYPVPRIRSVAFSLFHPPRPC